MHFRFNNIVIRKTARCWDSCLLISDKQMNILLESIPKCTVVYQMYNTPICGFWQKHILLTNCRQNTLNSNFAKGTYQFDPLVHYKLSMHFFFLSPSILCLYSMPKHILIGSTETLPYLHFWKSMSISKKSYQNTQPLDSNMTTKTSSLAWFYSEICPTSPPDVIV